MPAIFLFCALLFFLCRLLPAAEVDLGKKPVQTLSPSVSASPAGPMASPVAVSSKYRPAMLGTGPLSVINRINVQVMVQKGQKDATMMFCCSVKPNGEVASISYYRESPESTVLQEEVTRCFRNAILIPGSYDGHPVHVLMFGTIKFKVVDGKPRLRIFLNQEASELEKEADFVGPQPFIGRESKFEGLHYPNDVLSSWLDGTVELGMQIDADGNLKELRVVSEHPPLAGFARAAAEDFRVARFIPAFRNGKPVECSITLPVHYEP